MPNLAKDNVVYIGARYSTQGKRGYVVYKCPVCNAVFKRTLSYHKYRNGLHFCSQKCAMYYRINNSAHNYSTSFLDEDNEFRSYFLGLFMTNGHLSKSKVAMISLTDEQLINSIAALTNYKNPIKKIVRCIKNRKPQYKLVFCGKIPLKLYEFGFPYGKKTGKEFIPKCVSDNTFPHFLRGVIDGDGSFFVHHSQGKGLLNCKIFSASNNLVENILEKLRKNKIVFGGSISCKYGKTNLYTLLFGQNDSRRIGDYIYAGSIILLHRKKAVWEDNANISVRSDIQKNKVCSILECTNPSRSNGLCAVHYGKKYRSENKDRIRQYNTNYACKLKRARITNACVETHI